MKTENWFISNNLQDWIKSTDIIPALKTDHSAIMLTMEDNELKHTKGQGFWKVVSIPHLKLAATVVAVKLNCLIPNK